MKKLLSILLYGIFLSYPSLLDAEETSLSDSVAANTQFLKVDAKELSSFANDTKKIQCTVKTSD